MKIVIDTQFRENYGAHDWDGTGTCPQYWKYKGGDSYVVRDLTIEQATNVKNIMARLKPLLEYANDYAEEYIIDWNIEDDDAAECEEWETPWDISIESNDCIASRFVKADEYWKPGFVGKQESYVMLAAGERDKYECAYVKEEVAA